jgi:hypothetical protein
MMLRPISRTLLHRTYRMSAADHERIMQLVKRILPDGQGINKDELEYLTEKLKNITPSPSEGELDPHDAFREIHVIHNSTFLKCF